MGKSRYKVELSSPALDDLEAIVAFISSDNPQAAVRFGQQLIKEAAAIALHPFAGRMVPEFGSPAIREKIFRSYRIVYRVDEEHHLIVVSRFWHAARGTPVLGEADDESPEAT